MSAPRYCEACGAVIPAGDRFCAACGKPIASEPIQPAPQSPPPTAASQDELLIFENALGRITDRRLSLAHGRGPKGGNARRDIPLRFISSVEYEVERHPALAVFFLVGAVALARQGGAEIGLGLASLARLVMTWGLSRRVDEAPP